MQVAELIDLDLLGVGINGANSQSTASELRQRLHNLDSMLAKLHSMQQSIQRQHTIQTRSKISQQIKIICNALRSEKTELESLRIDSKRFLSDYETFLNETESIYKLLTKRYLDAQSTQLSNWILEIHQLSETIKAEPTNIVRLCELLLSLVRAHLTIAQSSSTDDINGIQSQIKTIVGIIESNLSLIITEYCNELRIALRDVQWPQIGNSRFVDTSEPMKWSIVENICHTLLRIEYFLSIFHKIDCLPIFAAAFQSIIDKLPQRKTQSYVVDMFVEPIIKRFRFSFLSTNDIKNQTMTKTVNHPQWFLTFIATMIGENIGLFNDIVSPLIVETSHHSLNIEREFVSGCVHITKMKCAQIIALLCDSLSDISDQLSSQKISVASTLDSFHSNTESQLSKLEIKQSNVDKLIRNLITEMVTFQTQLSAKYEWSKDSISANVLDLLCDPSIYESKSESKSDDDDDDGDDDYRRQIETIWIQTLKDCANDGLASVQTMLYPFEIYKKEYISKQKSAHYVTNALQTILSTLQSMETRIDLIPHRKSRYYFTKTVILQLLNICCEHFDNEFQTNIGAIDDCDWRKCCGILNSCEGLSAFLSHWNTLPLFEALFTIREELLSSSDNEANIATTMKGGFFDDFVRQFSQMQSEQMTQISNTILDQFIKESKRYMRDKMWSKPEHTHNETRRDSDADIQFDSDDDDDAKRETISDDPSSSPPPSSPRIGLMGNTDMNWQSALSALLNSMYACYDSLPKSLFNTLRIMTAQNIDTHLFDIFSRGNHKFFRETSQQFISDLEIMFSLFVSENSDRLSPNMALKPAVDDCSDIFPLLSALIRMLRMEQKSLIQLVVDLGLRRIAVSSTNVNTADMSIETSGLDSPTQQPLAGRKAKQILKQFHLQQLTLTQIENVLHRIASTK